MLKVSQFQNEFMNWLFLAKYEQKIVKISAFTTQGRNPNNFFCSYFGRNDYFINSFWNWLTFTNWTWIIDLLFETHFNMPFHKKFQLIVSYINLLHNQLVNDPQLIYNGWKFSWKKLEDKKSHFNQSTHCVLLDFFIRWTNIWSFSGLEWPKRKKNLLYPDNDKK